MKGLKAIGLAAVVITMMSAIFGANTASATTLCKVNVNACPALQSYPAKETILASLKEKTTLHYEALNAGKTLFSGECKESSISWSTTENRGPNKVLFGNVSTFLFGQCKNGGMFPCEKATAENLPYNAELTATALGDGSAYWVNGSSGARKLNFVKCGFLSNNCTYENSPMLVVLEGGNPATVLYVWEIKSEAGGNPSCGEKMRMVAEYTVASPKPLYVQKEP